MYVRFSAAEQSEVWDRFEAGESMRSIARSIGRSQGGGSRLDPEDRRHPSAGAHGVVRQLGCHWLIGRRSPVGLPPGCRCGRWRPDWDGHRRRSLERWPPTAAGIATGPVMPRRRPAVELDDRGRPSWLGARSFAVRWRANWRNTGRLSRSPTGCPRRSPTTRRCG